jgi:hypothetical protein
MIYTFLTIVFCLALIGAQDLKSRSFYTLLIPSLAMLSLLYNYLLKENGLSFKELGFNTAYILLTLSALQAYYYFKNKSFVLITSKAFALGDVLLLFVAALLFPLKTLIILLLSASVVSLIFYFFSSDRIKKRGIPFAGILAFIIIPALIVQTWV